MSDIPARLGQILLAKQVITEQQLELALQYQARHNKPVGHCLMALGFIKEKDLSRALRRQSWMKPCAACLTSLCALFTFAPCFTDNSSTDVVQQQ
jgi:AraC-like DNA-binding protein